MRKSIIRDHADYYDIKRHLSTFNKNRKKEHYCRDQQSDGEEGNGESSSMTVCPLTRFERLFTPRRNNTSTGMHSTNENQYDSNERTNTYFENQLRMMIYGN